MNFDLYSSTSALASLNLSSNSSGFSNSGSHQNSANPSPSRSPSALAAQQQLQQGSGNFMSSFPSGGHHGMQSQGTPYPYGPGGMGATNMHLYSMDMQSACRNTLWMGDLDPWMDENFVKQLWLQFGEHVNVKMIRDKFSGMNAGYCFVEFTTVETATMILQSLNGQPLPGTSKFFRLNWASGGGIHDKKDQGPEFSIFVGDLGPDVNDDLLFSIFHEVYPSCKTAKVVTDAMTGLSRGYGFVRFSDENEQQRSMMEMNGNFCGSRPMRISVATPKNRFASIANWSNVYGGNIATPLGGNPLASAFGAGPSIGGNLNSMQTNNVNMNNMQMNNGNMNNGSINNIFAPNSASSNNAPNVNLLASNPLAALSMTSSSFDPNNTTVFVGGLTNTFISEEELAGYFAPFGPITYVKIPPGKGCGFVSFVHRQSAEQAIASLNGCLISGNRVRLSWGRNNGTSSSPSNSPSPTLGGNGFVGADWKSAPSSGNMQTSSSSMHNSGIYSPTTPPSAEKLSYSSGGVSGSSIPSSLRNSLSTSNLALMNSNSTSPVTPIPSGSFFQGSRSLFGALDMPAPAGSDTVLTSWKNDADPVVRPSSALGSASEHYRDDASFNSKHGNVSKQSAANNEDVLKMPVRFASAPNSPEHRSMYGSGGSGILGSRLIASLSRPGSPRVLSSIFD